MFYRATYEDGSVVEQPATQIPIEYHNIDTNNLQEFILRGDKILIGANLKNGTLLLEGKEILFDGFSEKKGYRLIYFTKMNKDKVMYFLGLQTTLNGKNLKRVFKLNDEEVKILV